MNRITADIDNDIKDKRKRQTKPILKLKDSIHRGLLFIEDIKQIEVYNSNSKGYHIVFWTTKNYSKKKQLELRKIILDDKNRIRLDKKRKIGTQTLWNKKKYL